MFNSNDTIALLMQQIELLILEKHDITRTIKNPKLLIEGLKELQQMVEMHNIKQTIVDQIKFLLTNKLRPQESYKQFDGHMLHACISGQPGVGKTSIAKILGKIWTSLDMIKKPIKKPETTYTQELEQALIAYNQKLKYTYSELDIHMQLCKDIKNTLYKIKYNQVPKGKYLDCLRRDVRELKFSMEDLYEDLSVEPQTIVENDEVIFVTATREDFVASFLGQTAPKARKVMEKALGGVLFIDEAYSLYHNDRDSFGEEALVVINEFMSLHADEIIVIFAGYKDLLLDTIFKAQPGLQRRCSWFFEIEEYTCDGLSQIFKLQLEKHGWILDEAINIKEYFLKHKKYIKNAGDTEKLVLQAKMAYAEYHFSQLFDPNPSPLDSIISSEIINLAMQKLIKSQPKKEHHDAPKHMYL